MGTESGGRKLQALKEALDLKKTKIQRGVLLWASSTRPRYPWRQPGKSVYEVLLGEVSIGESNAAVATEVWQGLVKHFGSIRALAEAKEADLRYVLSGFALEEQAHDIKALAESLLTEGRGDVPKDAESFAKVSKLEDHGIRAVMCFGYNVPTAVMDRHVERMLSRLFMDAIPPHPSHGLLRAIAEGLLSYRCPQEYNRAMLDFAESVCHPEPVLCGGCPLRDACDFAKRLSEFTKVGARVA